MRSLPFLAVFLTGVCSSGAVAQTTLATASAPDIPWFRITLSFLLCIALATAAIFGLRAYHARGGRGLRAFFEAKGRPRSNKITIVEMCRINPHADLCVVNFREEELLLSVGRDGTHVVARAPRQPEVSYSIDDEITT